MEKVKMGMKNTYTIYKVVDGQKQVLAHFHNVVLDQFRKALVNTYCRIHSVWFGTGNTEPSESDTKLTSPLWTFSWNYNQVVSEQKPYISDDNTWNVECTCKVDATADYVGTVSEVGIAFAQGSSLILGTHALIRDAEGNPMTITKTDQELLYVDIHIQYQLGTSKGFEWNPWYLYLLQNLNNWFPVPGLCRPTLAMCRAYPDMMTGGNYIGSRIVPSASYSADTRVLTCSNGRFGADNQETQDYVNCLALFFDFNGSSSSSVNYQNGVPAGWWKFPNAEIFPNQTLKDMRIGTGDGSTTEFTPPLNFWVKDSEKIYIDGSLQVRGVDYTCDHRNNLSNLYSLNPSIFSSLRSEIIRTDSYTSSSNYGVNPLKGGIAKCLTSSGDYRRTYIQWDADHPLIWELEEDPQIGLEADYFQLSSIYSTASSGYWTNAVVTVSYSSDGEAWTEASSYTVTERNYSLTHTFEFEETIKAKYWKVDIDVSACSTSLQEARFYTTSISYLHRNGSPIVFKTAPAEGAIITMEADIDRPMKNSNFILDVNPTFQL